MKNKLLLLIFLALPTTGNAVSWPWSWFVPSYMKQGKIDSYQCFKCSFLLWFGIELGKRTTGDGMFWGEKLNPIFSIGSFSHATIIRGMAHGRNANITPAAFNKAYQFMMAQRKAAKEAPYPEEHFFYQTQPD
jgi:hypothetical protein